MIPMFTKPNYIMSLLNLQEMFRVSMEIIEYLNYKPKTNLFYITWLTYTIKLLIKKQHTLQFWCLFYDKLYFSCFY